MVRLVGLVEGLVVVLMGELAIVIVGSMISISVSFCDVILSTADLVAINWGGEKNTDSVLNDMSSRQICMSSPNLATCWW